MKRKETVGKRRLISDIGPNDVLLGRGAGPNEHIGNITFRQIVADHKKTYMNTTNRKIKNQIAQQAIREVRANKGRFLQKVKDKDGDLYTPADENVVLEKTKQALRHLDRPKKPSEYAYAQTVFFGNENTGPSSWVLTNEVKQMMQFREPQALPDVTPQAVSDKYSSLLLRYNDVLRNSPSSQMNSAASILDHQLSLVAASNAQRDHDDLVTLLALNRLKQEQSPPLPRTTMQGRCPVLPPPIFEARPTITHENKAILAAERLQNAIALLQNSRSAV